MTVLPLQNYITIFLGSVSLVNFPPLVFPPSDDRYGRCLHKKERGHVCADGYYSLDYRQLVLLWNHAGIKEHPCLYVYGQNNPMLPEMHSV